MTAADVGSAGLIIAFSVSMLAAVAGMFAAAMDSAAAARMGRWLLGAVLLSVTVSAAALMRAILTDQFTLNYVYAYSERALPLGYKLAVFWAGQAGSLLLWAWLIAAMGVLAAFWVRRRPAVLQGGAILTLAVVTGFFCAVMYLVDDTDPFHSIDRVAQGTPEQIARFSGPSGWPVHMLREELGAEIRISDTGTILIENAGRDGAARIVEAIERIVGPLGPGDGRGLNPMLQDPAMIAHPPMMFLGYAGFTIPLALLVGGLLLGRLDDDWLTRVRRWSMTSWVFLWVGIVLGAWWAYIELGWGGYWAWDPVENASLLPWLTGIALLHALVVMKYRRMFKPLTAILILVTFLLCIFGTWLTRSGVISSVHSFGLSDVGQSEVGRFFMWFMVVVGVLTIALMVARWRALSAETAAEWGGREWLMFAAGGLAVLMMALTLFGTMWPVIGQALARLTGQQAPARAEVGQSFYNNYVLLLLGLPLAALMAFGPLIAYGKRLPEYLGRLVGFALMVGAVAAGVMLVLLWPDRAWVAAQVPAEQVDSELARLLLNALWTGLAVGVAVVGAGMLAVDFARSLGSRRRATGEGGAWAALRVLDQNRRRYGAQLAHVGVLLLMLAIVGSSLFDIDESFTLARGASRQVGPCTVTYEGLTEREGPNYTAWQATVRLTDDRGDRVLRPEIRRYHKRSDKSQGKIALDAGLLTDRYAALLGSGQDGGVVSLRVLVKPMMLWLWIGSTLIVLGGLLALTRPLGSAVRIDTDSDASDGRQAETVFPAAESAAARPPDLPPHPPGRPHPDHAPRRPERQPVRT